MTQVSGNIEISTLRAIALSQDQLASLQAVQQLLNKLSVGQRVEGQILVDQSNNQNNAVLVIEDTRLVISDEQIKKLPPHSEKITLEVIDLNGAQLVLKKISPEILPVKADNPQTTQDNVPASKEIDTNKLLRLIEQINPTLTDTDVIRKTLKADEIKGPHGAVNSYNSQIQTARLPDYVSSTQKFNDKPQRFNTNQVVTQTVIQTQQINNPVAQDNLSASVNKSGGVHQNSSPHNLGVPGNNATNILPQSVPQTVQPSLKDSSGVSQTITYSVPQTLMAPASQKTQPGSATQDTERVATRETHASNSSIAVNLTHSATLDSNVTVQATVPSTQLSNHANLKPAAEISSVITSVPERNSDISQPDPVKQSDSSGSHLTGKSSDLYTQPTIKLAIETPGREAFPLLANSVSQEAKRLAGNQTNLSKSLNSLFAQLSRLNQWQIKNKRLLRTESGAPLNKATRDTMVAIKDIQRYIATDTQLKTAIGLKKAIRQSGNFFEAKMATKHQSQNHTQSSIHQDAKTNTQRLISAVLYHIAKLQMTATTTSQATTSPINATKSDASISPQLSAMTNTKTQADLVKLVNQRLEAVGARQIPTDLPTQLLRILKQILNESHRAMTKLQSGQLVNLRPDTLPPQWFFEIPVWQQQAVEMIQILMRRETKQNKDKQNQVWSLVLQFNIEQLGKIRTILKWSNQSIDIRFLAEHSPTVELINSEIAYIYDMISRNDLVIENVAVDQAELRDISIDFGIKQNS